MRHECKVCGWVLEDCDLDNCETPEVIVCMDCMIKAEESSKWDEAIADAKAKIKRLRSSIAIFEARKTAGDRWPE